MLVVFGVLGAVFLVVGVWTFFSTRSFIATAARADGVVIDLELSRSDDSSTYYPIVAFRTQDGQEIEYQSNTGTNPPSFRVGESVTVLYDPQDPYDARIEAFSELWLFSIIFGSVGLVFFGVFAGTVVFGMRRKRKEAWLRAHGRAVTATYQSVEQDCTVRVNNRCAYRILAQGSDGMTSSARVFRSRRLWRDPAGVIPAGQEITVYLDPNNPEKYFMDVSFLDGPPVAHSPASSS